MKFAIAPVTYWDSIGFDTTEWRKSLDGTKAICHLEYAEKLGANLHANPQVQIIDSVDPNLKNILESSEWVIDGTNGDLDSFSFLTKLNQFETKVNDAVAEKVAINEQKVLSVESQLQQTEQELNVQLAQTDVELRRKRELEDLSPTVLAAIEGGEGTNFNLLSIPQDESVNQKKLQKAKYLKVKSINRFDKSKATQGFIHSASGRAANANWYTTDFFTPVTLGDVIRVNLPYATTIILYDDNSNYLSAKGAVTNNVPLEYTVGVGVKSVKFNIYKDNIDSFMFTINQPLPVAYEPFSEDLIAVPWLTPEYNSINPSHFTNDVIPFIQEKIEVPTPSENKKSDWEGKKFVSLGTSITFQDGKTYQQGNIGAIARGYQTIMKEKLGFDGYLNKGMSGKPLANGTTAGEGILETGKSTSYADYDLVTIEVGTNDFKLNVPIGAKGMIGDVAFDNTTFFGAFRELLEFILSVKPSIRIVLLTPLQRDNGGYNVNTANPSGHKLINYVNAIEEIGEMYGLPVCDLYRNSGFTKKTLAIFTMDGLHPNDVGYARMGNTLSGLVKNVGV